MVNYIKEPEIRNIVQQALKEDIGTGDITTQKTIPKSMKIRAVIVAKEKGVVCGIEIAKLVFKTLDKRIQFAPLVKDGERINKGKILAKLYGLASSIATAERVALNFLSLLSGIATRTHDFVRRVRPYHVEILDTRKTIPGMRKLEKYAVRIGGGMNHRQRLDEMILIKDNHIEVMGRQLCHTGLEKIIKRVRKEIPPRMKIEVEVRNLREFKEALCAKPDMIMLDNMHVKEIRKAAQLKNQTSPVSGHRALPKLEVSGNIHLKNIHQYAVSGIDFISLGTLTKDVQSLDISLEFTKYQSS